MKIVVLDAYTTNLGDLSWEALQRLGDCVFYDRTAPSEVLARASEADAVIINKVLLPAEVLAQLPKLRYIGLLSTGVNVVDVAAAKGKGIAVCNVPGYSTPSVAQLVFAFILAFTNEVETHSASARAGEWAHCPDFCYWKSPLVELEGLTLGLVGYGQIAQAVAKIARAFDMRILVHTRTPQESSEGIEFVELEELLRRSDFVSLHCPLSDATHHLINAERLAWMKPTAILINTGRGGLLDDVAVATALNNGRIAGAGLDVLTEEPPRQSQPLLTAPNCKITPHLAWATRAARTRLIAIASANLANFLAGKPSNNVA